MFPWSPEFRWDVGHVAFFGAFYSVLAVVAATLVRALWKARAARDKVHEIQWHVEFSELPSSARVCRHQLTGSAPGRVCPNDFDCRCCGAHPHFAAQESARPAAAATLAASGFELPANRLFHRGHTFVQPEADGTVTIGLDDFARRVVGTTESVELPKPGARLAANGPAVLLRTRGSEARILAPVDATVISSQGDDSRFQLRVRPDGPLDARHLLTADEARPWLLRETERLRVVLTGAGLGPALDDSGALRAAASDTLPRQYREAVLGAVFLEP